MESRSQIMIDRTTWERITASAQRLPFGEDRM